MAAIKREVNNINKNAKAKDWDSHQQEITKQRIKLGLPIGNTVKYGSEEKK